MINCNYKISYWYTKSRVGINITSNKACSKRCKIQHYHHIRWHITNTTLLPPYYVAHYHIQTMTNIKVEYGRPTFSQRSAALMLPSLFFILGRWRTYHHIKIDGHKLDNTQHTIDNLDCVHNHLFLDMLQVCGVAD